MCSEMKAQYTTRGWRDAGLGLLLLGWAAATTGFAAEIPCPIAAHNCYSDAGVLAAEKRLAEALSVGLKYIEVDVNHNPAAGGFVVTHKSENPPLKPLLADYLKPLWAQWRNEPNDKHILIIEPKAGQPEAVARGLHDYLAGYRDLLTTFATDGTVRHKGPISVCLTGVQHLGQAYLDHASKGGEWLACRDEGFGNGPGARDALRACLARPAKPGVRFLTIEWGVVVGRRGYVDPLTPEASAWLDEIVAGARRNNYHLRFYTINVRHTYHRDERLEPGGWDHPWRACAKAGVEMIATDQYSLGVQWWEQVGRNIASGR